MKLSKEQIEKIDALLVKKDVTYLDIKLELVDHIASEIEEVMEKTNQNFDSVLRIVFEKWNNQLKFDTSFWLGIFYSFPKVMLKELEKKERKVAFISFTFLVIWFLIYFNKEVIIENALLSFTNFFKTISLVLSFFMALLIALVNYKPKPTSYRFLMNRYVPLVIINLPIIWVSSDGSFQFIYFVLTSIYSVYHYQNYISHITFLKKTGYATR